MIRFFESVVNIILFNILSCPFCVVSVMISILCCLIKNDSRKKQNHNLKKKNQIMAGKYDYDGDGNEVRSMHNVILFARALL